MLQLVPAGIPETLAEGVMTFPLCVFSALFVQHYGEVDYVMPFVLWYSFQRAGLFFMSCLGTVTNPYRICIREPVLTLIGCLCTLLGASHPLWWNVGAALVGLGLSGFPAMYRTVRDEIQRGGALKRAASRAPSSCRAAFLSRGSMSWERPSRQCL